MLLRRTGTQTKANHDTTRNGARRRAIHSGLVGLLIVVLGLLNPVAAVVPPAAHGELAPSPSSLQPSAVHLAHPPAMMAAGRSVADMLKADRQRRSDQLAATLKDLAASGQAGAYRFDDQTETFHLTLTDAATRALASNPLVGSVEAEPAKPLTATPPAATRSFAASHKITTQSFTSDNFIQVYSPFMWGRAPNGGLNISLTLEDSGGNTIGVPEQTFNIAPNNYVKIDAAQLYYETVFEDPTTQQPVIIVPGDKVHAVLTGTDITTGQYETDDRTITVVDIRAYTSLLNGSVSGTAPPSSTMYVTVASGSLFLDSYLQGGTNTYAQLTSDASGNYSVNQFHVNGASSTSPMTFGPAVTGFVRVRLSSGDEVYTVHGQNVQVLENSNIVSGYAFSLPSSPFQLDPTVPVLNRPAPTVAVTLKSSAGSIKGTASTLGSMIQWWVAFTGQTIYGTDSVTVTINGSLTNVISTSPLTASVDLVGQQVTGSGPANTILTGGEGQVDGYVTKYSYVIWTPLKVTTNGSGGFATGVIPCGSSATMPLQPSSFGYLGYEDGHANYIYLNYAAPRNDVMTNFPYVEGWLANGANLPTVTVKDSGGNLKSQQTGTEQIMWMVTTQLFVNLYYILPTTQFILPGDTATITAGGQTWTIPVDSLSSYLNSDTYTVFGSAPPGQNVKVIDGTQRSVSQIVTASSSGAYSATNPFATYFDGSCSSMAQSLIFGPGHAGRAYLTHSDGNAVFAVWARSMHVNENENFLEVFAYSTQNLDWYDPGFVQVTASRTPAGGGTPNGATAKSDGGQAGDTKINIVDSSNNKIIIRPGDTISVSFTEGVGTASRTATLTATAIPQVTGVPDVTSGTLAGIGPSAWSGRATLANPPSTPIAINARTYPAFGPASFTQYGGTPVPLIMGYAGDVSFTDSTGNRVWSAWAVTAFPVKITKIPNVGDTMVCGTAPASSPVRIHDFTNQPTDVIIGTGSSDANGNFCVATTPLFKGQVIMAESNGTFSQPIVVGIAHLVFIPVTFH